MKDRDFDTIQPEKTEKPEHLVRLIVVHRPEKPLPVEEGLDVNISVTVTGMQEEGKLTGGLKEYVQWAEGTLESAGTIDKGLAEILAKAPAGLGQATEKLLALTREVMGDGSDKVAIAVAAIAARTLLQSADELVQAKDEIERMKTANATLELMLAHYGEAAKKDA